MAELALILSAYEGAAKAERSIFIQIIALVFLSATMLYLGLNAVFGRDPWPWSQSKSRSPLRRIVYGIGGTVVLLLLLYAIRIVSR